MPRILGVSHLIVTTPDPEAAAGRLAALGYAPRGNASEGANPPAKAPYVHHPMPPVFNMLLLVSDRGLPPVELLLDPPEGPAPGQPCFTLGIGNRDSGEPGTILPGIEIGHPVLGGATALVVRTSSVAASVALWRALGFEPTPDGDRRMRVRLPRTIVGTALDLLLVEEPAAPTTVDQRGAVCLSLLCTNTGKLRGRLLSQGIASGDPFRTAPFGQPLDGFFLRGAGGDLYELLSPGAKDDKR